MRIPRIRMIVERHARDTFSVIVRLGCDMPKGYVGDGVRHSFLPYRKEVYPSLSTYWKIRLLH